MFVNCPFDPLFRPLLKPLLFTLLYYRLTPRISETSSSSDIRINEIKKLIGDSKYSIHDLSRCRPVSRNEPPRFNMPYELGIDIGCLSFGKPRHRSKRLLILEKEKHHYKIILSDIAGQDIEDHNDDPEQLIRRVRNWIFSVVQGAEADSANAIWTAYLQFNDDLDKQLSSKNYSAADIDEMPFSEYIKFAGRWLDDFL